MTERDAIRLLESFALGEYITKVRAVGRRKLDRDLREAASSLHRDLVTLNATARGRLSPDVRTKVDIALRVLASEAEFDRQLRETGEIVPRYLWYTSVRTLNFAVGLTERQPISEQFRSTAHALRILVEDWTDYERDAAAGAASFGLVDLDLTSVRLRLERLTELASVLPSAATDDPDGDIPQTFNSLSGKIPNLEAIKYLTAFPMTSCHDEYAFLRAIHITEVVFRSTLQCVWEARAQIAAGDLGAAADYITATTANMAVIAPTFRTLRTMPENNFAEGFRAATGQASAQQSLSYQHLETLIKGQNDTHKRVILLDKAPEVAPVLAYDGDHFLPLAEQVQLIDGFHPEAQRLWDATLTLLNLVYRWRTYHELQFAAKRYVPESARGTGGTEGRAYLARQTFPRGSALAIEPITGRHRHRRPGPAASLKKEKAFPMLPVVSREL